MSDSRVGCLAVGLFVSVGLLTPTFPAEEAADAEEAEEAGPHPTDKSQYHLFHPVPHDLLRDLSTDRPDTTESPYSVDAGHFQLEMSLIDYTHDRRNAESETRHVLSVAPMILKAGLLEDVDLQLGLDPFIHEEVKDRTTGEEETVSGFGDLLIRVKWNLWGNDEGMTAFALMPFVKFPTAHRHIGNGECEGGLIAPLAISLPMEFSLGLMPEIDVVRNPDDDRHIVDFLHTAALGRDLIGDLGAFIEYAGFVDLSGEQDYRAYFDAGMTYALSSEIQLDGGIRVGLTRAADDFALFLGISIRV